jgi:hypothetical protein
VLTGSAITTSPESPLILGLGLGLGLGVGLRRDRADLGALQVQSQLAQDAYAISQRHGKDLEQERDQLQRKGDAADATRPREIGEELEQLGQRRTARRPPPLAKSDQRATRPRRSAGSMIACAPGAIPASANCPAVS